MLGFDEGRLFVEEAATRRFLFASAPGGRGTAFAFY